MNKLIKSLISLFLMGGLIGVLGGCGQSVPVVGNVGDKAISKAQFEAYLQFKRIDAKGEKAATQRDDHLQRYLQREALTLAIEKTGVLDQQMVSAELNEFKKQMVINRYFDTFLKAQISDSAIRNYYTSHSEQFEAKKVKVAHILIRTHNNMDEAQRSSQYTRAHEAFSKLKANGDFAQVVGEYSEDTISAKKDGVIGWLNEGAIDPVFSAKVFNELKKGQLSEPFQSSFGFHIVKIIEGPMVVKKPLEKVKGDIRHQLRKAAKATELARLTNAITISQ